VCGLYVTGWIKRGPSGVIGTNKPDALETARSVRADAEAGRLRDLGGGAEDVADLLAARGVAAVSFDDWRRMDAHEVATGDAQGRPRVKLVTDEEVGGVLGR
jgi:ferredoxin--NADP+ reductase